MERLKVQEALKGKVKLKRLFIYGEEEFLTRQLIKKLLLNREFEKFYPENIEDFFNFQSSSLFKGEAVPVILYAEELPKNLRKKGEKERFIKKLKELKTFIIAALTELDGKTLKGELFSQIIENCDYVVKSEPYTEKQAYLLIAKKFKEAGREIPKEVIKLIVESVGTDLNLLKHETDKLLSYPGEITPQVVKELLFKVPDLNQFEIVYNLIRNRKKEFLKEVNEFILMGGEPLQLIGLMETQLRQIIELTCGRSVKLPKEVIKRHKTVGKEAGIIKLLKTLKALTETEFKLKSGELPPKEALKLLAFKEN